MKIRFAALAPLGLALVLAACGSQQAEQPPAAEPEAPSSEWVAENPTEPAVPVTLPTTAMTNVPASEAAPAAK
ncbi:MAG: hypothetical protein ACK4YM_03835 [Novosphingobium sp.]